MNQSSTLHCRIGQLSLIVAIVLACHSAVAALTSEPAGCGGAGCADAMSSQWAMVMGIPVALLAVVLYSLTLVLSASGSSGRKGTILRSCFSLILMAAVYFMAIQIFRIGSLCALCTATHVFAVVGVLMISRGLKTCSFAFSPTAPCKALPVFLAAGCLAGLAILQSHGAGGGRMQQVRLVADQGREFPNEMLIKPFVAANGNVGVLLDGGTIPVFGAEVPEIQLGETSGRVPLQVVLLNDWTCAHCVELHAMLHQMYHSPGSDSLPPVTLRLLPVFFDAKAESAHRAMLNVHFGTGNPAAFPTLAREIASGKLSPDPASIRSRLSDIDSPTAERWETLSGILEKSVSQAFALGRSQLLRNSSHLKVSSLPQLTVFDAVLAGLPTETELATFLSDAATRQQALLDSPHAPQAPAMNVACACGHSAESPDHVHGTSCSTIAGVKPNDPSDVRPSAIDGPQLKFDYVSLKTQPIAMGEAAEATFHFTNTGNQTLVVHMVHTGCGCVVANDWSREVAPGEKGRVSLTYDTRKKPDAGFGEHVRHIWVASNSVTRTDPSYGDPLEIKVPVIGKASHPGTLSMTASAPLSSHTQH